MWNLLNSLWPIFVDCLGFFPYLLGCYYEDASVLYFIKKTDSSEFVLVEDVSSWAMAPTDATKIEP